jgi:hypothetical protein
MEVAVGMAVAVGRGAMVGVRVGGFKQKQSIMRPIRYQLIIAMMAAATTVINTSPITMLVLCVI